MSTTTLSARDRLLAAANELFYEEGVRTVGIDRVIERAGVAKASLYNTFGSKEELVRAYLAGRHASRQERVMRSLDRFSNPRDRLLGIYDVLAEVFSEPGYRGCAFHNASAESAAGSSVEQVCDSTRAWTRSLFTDLAREAGALDPAGLATQLVLLYDGATTGAQMDRNPATAATAKAIAANLLDAAVRSGAPR
jgi:AcrR family transcriptional regulator